MTENDLLAKRQRALQLVDRAESLVEEYGWDAADGLFREAMHLDPSACSRIAYGVALARQERYFDSISIFTPVLDQTDRTAIGIVCHNLASIYRETGDHDLARRFQWRATLLNDEVDVEGVLGLANDALASDRYQLAEALITTAQGLNDDDEQESFDGDLIATTGLVKSVEAPAEGLLLLFTAYRRHQASQNYRGMGIDLVNMSSLFGRLGRNRAERRCLVRAIRCFEQCWAPVQSQRARKLLERLDSLRFVRSFDARRN